MLRGERDAPRTVHAARNREPLAGDIESGRTLLMLKRNEV
jgi:hypothetical protein